MKKIYNPSMQEEPYNHPTQIIPSSQEETILGWLERTGRFLSPDLENEDEGTDDLVDEMIEVEAYQIDEYDWFSISLCFVREASSGARSIISW
jgi:hypothetical protein